MSEPEVERAPELILEVFGLMRSFGGVHAVNGVSFGVQRGKITGLIGPNGAGKSTLLSLVAGTDRPDAGTISYQGTDISNLPAHRRAEAGMIRTFQISSEFGHMSVLENMLVGASGQRGGTFLGALRGRRYWGKNQAELVERARGLLARFGIAHSENMYAADLSGGQKRLLEIARSLMTNPTVLLLDEPFAGVNPSLARSVEQHLLALREEGLTMLMVEHELGAVDRCTDSVIVMTEGSVLARGTMAEIRQRQEVVHAYLVG